MDKVSVALCGSYDEGEVCQKVKNALGLLDLQSSPKGKTVLLKVNCLMAAPPERHITTHPAVVSALCRYFLETGAKKVQIGDSSGGGLAPAGQNRTKNALKVCGMAEVAEKHGAELVDFDKSKIVTFETPYMKIGIAEPVLKADLLVSVPKLKTHVFTKYTGAVKNMFGCLPGDAKANVHRIAGGEPKFSEMLLDVYSVTKPSLAVMDAIIGMEGNGPTSGKPRKIGAILASKNPAALDRVACEMVGFPPTEINTNRIAAERSLVSAGPVKTVGAPPPKIRDFKRPATMRASVMRLAHNMFYNLTRLQPVADCEKCTGCATCAKGCPVGAIEMVANRPKFDRKKCIYCYCCHELCPHSAMMLKRAPKLPFFG